jgi:hypothetical protein
VNFTAKHPMRDIWIAQIEDIVTAMSSTDDDGKPLGSIERDTEAPSRDRSPLPP